MRVSQFEPYNTARTESCVVIGYAASGSILLSGVSRVVGTGAVPDVATGPLGNDGSVRGGSEVGTGCPKATMLRIAREPTEIAMRRRMVGPPCRGPGTEAARKINE